MSNDVLTVEYLDKVLEKLRRNNHQMPHLHYSSSSLGGYIPNLTEAERQRYNDALASEFRRAT